MKSHSTVTNFPDTLHPRKQGFEVTPTLRALFIIVIIFATCSTVITTIYDYLAKWLRRLFDFNF
jgi:hypothetical protein